MFNDTEVRITEKYYYGINGHSDSFSSLWLGTIGLLEQYNLKKATNQLKTPWFTIEDVKTWCKDDRHLEQYLKQGVECSVFRILNEKEASLLQKDPFHDYWLYEKSQRNS